MLLAEQGLQAAVRLARAGEKEAFVTGLKARFEALRAEGSFSEWE